MNNLINIVTWILSVIAFLLLLVSVFLCPYVDMLKYFVSGFVFLTVAGVVYYGGNMWLEIKSKTKN